MMTAVTTTLQRQQHTLTIRRRGLSKTVLYTAVLLLAALYFLFPLVWLVISTTKTSPELFHTSVFSVHGQFWRNFRALFRYQSGIYWRWYLNSFIYAGLTAGLSTLVSAMAGFGLTYYGFGLKPVAQGLVLVALLVPGSVLSIPLFLVVRDMGLLNTYQGVILPFIASAFGVYFMRIYSASAFPQEFLDAGRMDGASDIRIFFRLASPMMLPGLVTLFLLSFVGAWNNFFFALLVLSNQHLYPVTLGLANWAATIANPSFVAPPPYMLLLTGSLCSIFPMLILFPWLRRYITAGGLTGGIQL